MHVLHVIPAIAPRYGGPSAATIGICQSLRHVGVSTLVATTDADGRGRLDVRLERVLTYEEVPTIFFRRQVSESFKWSKPLSNWLDAHVARFDVVHVHAVFSHSSIAAGRACRTHRVPYVVRPLGTLDPWSVNRKRFRKQVLFRLGVDDLLSGAAAMHYTSREEQRLAESVVPELRAGSVVPLGIDETCFAGTSGAEEGAGAPYVLSLSRVHEKKGLDLLIRAFHRVAGDPRFAAWRLVIAGDGDPAYVAALRSTAAAGAGRSRIEFRGWVSGVDKVHLLHGAALVASPSHQENFGISVVEAMAGGVPALVAPGVNLAAEIRDARAGWVAERDDASFARALADAMGDPAELRRRGDNARAYASQFRWPVVASRLMTLYESVLAASGLRTANQGLTEDQGRRTEDRLVF